MFRTSQFFISRLLSVQVLEVGRVMSVMDRINVTMEDKMIILEWTSSPDNDMTCAIRAQTQQNTIPKGVSEFKIDKFKLCDSILRMLRDMFGEESVSNVVKGERMTVTVSNKKLDVSLNDMKVTCPDDKTLETIVGNAVMSMYDTLMPCK